MEMKNKINFDKVLRKNTLLGCSSHIFYRGCEGVPFQWELEPGTPIKPTKIDKVAPLKPPPSLQNMGLSRPCFVDKQKKYASFKFNSKRILFWKRIKGNNCQESNVRIVDSKRIESLGPFDSDREFMASFRKDLSSSSSSSQCSLDFRPLQHITASMSERSSNISDRSTSKSTYADHGDGLFLSKIISRRSSVDHQSSRLYYRDPEGIPYEWEMQPGQSISPPDCEFPIPPPSPPPAVQSKDLPLPCLNRLKDPNTSRRLWIRRKESGKHLRKLFVLHLPNFLKLKSSSSSTRKF